MFANGLFVENSYDLAGRKSSLKLFDGSLVEYFYNGNYLSEIIRNGSYSHQFLSYDLDGNLVEEKPIGCTNSSKFERNAFGYISEITTGTYSQKVLKKGKGIC